MSICVISPSDPTLQCEIKRKNPCQDHADYRNAKATTNDGPKSKDAGKQQPQPDGDKNFAEAFEKFERFVITHQPVTHTQSFLRQGQQASGLTLVQHTRSDGGPNVVFGKIAQLNLPFNRFYRQIAVGIDANVSGNRHRFAGHLFGA